MPNFKPMCLVCLLATEFCNLQNPTGIQSSIYEQTRHIYIYHSHTKECPLLTFGPISCIASSDVQIWGKKLHLVLHRRFIMRQFCVVHVDNVATHIGLHCIVIVTWCGLECCVQTSKLLVAPSCVIACPIICFEDCKCDMGTLSWLNAGTLERTPTPLIDRLVRCSIHEHSLARLWYMHNNQCHTYG